MSPEKRCRHCGHPMGEHDMTHGCRHQVRSPNMFTPGGILEHDCPCYHVPQTRKDGVNAIIGKWPGDESDAQIADALRRLS